MPGDRDTGTCLLRRLREWRTAPVATRPSSALGRGVVKRGRAGRRVPGDGRRSRAPAAAAGWPGGPVHASLAPCLAGSCWSVRCSDEPAHARGRLAGGPGRAAPARAPAGAHQPAPAGRGRPHPSGARPADRGGGWRAWRTATGAGSGAGGWSRVQAARARSWQAKATARVAVAVGRGAGAARAWGALVSPLFLNSRVIAGRRRGPSAASSCRMGAGAGCRLGPWRCRADGCPLTPGAGPQPARGPVSLGRADAARASIARVHAAGARRAGREPAARRRAPARGPDAALEPAKNPSPATSSSSRPRGAPPGTSGSGWGAATSPTAAGW